MKSIHLTATKQMRSITKPSKQSVDLSGNKKAISIDGKSHQHKIFNKYGTYERNDIDVINQMPPWVSDRSFQFELIDSIINDYDVVDWPSMVEQCLTCEQAQWIVNEIKDKVNSYGRQDALKMRNTEREFDMNRNPITLNDACLLLKKEEYRCHYCRELLYIIHRNTREPLQWSLDRIDNTRGHDVDNLVVSCYKCNVNRRQRSYADFKKGKSVERFDKVG